MFTVNTDEKLKRKKHTIELDTQNTGILEHSSSHDYRQRNMFCLESVEQHII